MKCQRAREEIKAYIDGELGRVMRWRVAHHIASCAQCRKEMEIMSELTGEVQNAGSVPAPDGLRDKVISELTFGPVNESGRRWPYKTNPFALAGVLITVVVLAAIIMPVFQRARESARKAAVERNIGNAGLELKLHEPATISTSAAIPNRPIAESAPQQKMAAKAVRSNDLQPTSTQLMIIKTADLTVEVKSYQKASDSAISIAKSAGGFITDSSAASDQSSPSEGTMILRVPVDSFERTINRLNKLGKVKSRSVNGQDVTGEAVDLESRLRNKRAEERQYLDIMNRAKKIPDVVMVTNELSRVRGEIEEAQGRLKYLKSASGMSTINLSLAEKKIKHKPVAASPIRTAFDGATASLISTGNALASLIIWLAVYSPFWALPLGAWVIVRRRATVRE